jgi:hypothetical protein
MNKYTTHVCARCGRTYRDFTIRECPHPAVRDRLGLFVCYYCCKKCKHHTTMQYCGAIGCDYKNDDTKN